MTPLEFFSHPLLLLLVGAAVSSYLIPWLTNRWQDHKKEIEIKVDLISKMSDIIALAAGQAYLYRQKETDRSAFHKDMLEWLIKAGSSRSLLRIYFPDATISQSDKSKISDNWNKHLAVLSILWHFTYKTCDRNFDFRCRYDGMDQDLSTLRAYLENASAEIDWDKLCSSDNETVWNSLMQSVLSQGDDIIRAVIVSRLKIFNETKALSRIRT